MSRSDALRAGAESVREMIDSITAVRGKNFSMLVQYFINIGTGTHFNFIFTENLEMDEKQRLNFLVLHEAIYTKMVEILRELVEFSDDEVKEAMDWAIKVSQSAQRGFDYERGKQD